MNTEFIEIMNKIISVDELKEFSEVEKKLLDMEEGYIFQNNKPTHVLMTLEKYETLHANISSQEGTNISEDRLDILLNKIGKKIFVEYYAVFKSNHNCEALLEKEGFTLASRRSRCSSARQIFKNNLQGEALNNIIASGRMDVETVQKAQEILVQESDKSNKFSAKEQAEKSIKIGKMMRGILTILLQNQMFSEQEIEQMLTITYAKDTFHLNFPVLKEISSNQSMDDVKRDAKGYNRYYDGVVSNKGKEYLICSQWVESLHKKLAEQWIVDMMAAIVDKKVADLDMGSTFNVRDLLKEYWPYIDFNVRNRIGLKYKSYAKADPHVECKEMQEHGQLYCKVR